MSLLIAHGFTQCRHRVLGRAGAIVLLVIHAAMGLVLWPTTAAFYASLGAATAQRERSLNFDRSDLSDEELVLLSVPDVFVGLYLPYERRSRREPIPRAWRLLLLAECDHTVTRTADATVELELDGSMFRTSFEVVYRQDPSSLGVGDEVKLNGFSARVLGVDDEGRAKRLAFSFSHSLDDARIKLFGWHEGQMQPVRLAVGVGCYHGCRAPPASG